MVPEHDVLLETEGLCRYFGGVKAVHEITTSVRRGLVTSLIGPNGAGKTTVFNAVTGIFRATAGDVRLNHPQRGKQVLTGLRPDQICR
ncbi:ATP-binding cassette domain-containing protein, partial [Planctomycetota bacterium]